MSSERRRSSRLTGAPLGEVQSLDSVLNENRKRSRRCSSTSVNSDFDTLEKVKDSTPMDAVVEEPDKKRSRRCSNTSATEDVNTKEKVTDSTKNRKRSRMCSNTSASSNFDNDEKDKDSTPMDKKVQEPDRKRSRRCSNTSATDDVSTKVTDSTPEDDTKENDIKTSDNKKETNEKMTMDLNRYEKELMIKARCKSGRFWKSERDR